jgi:trehalose utilization protein
MKLSLLLSLMLLSHAIMVSAEPIHVLVWDEQQDRQAEAYENFLGNEIAARLDASEDELRIRSVNLNDPEQGLSAENLDWADVMIWWGHARQWEISAETAQRKIISRLKSGDLNMIFLHSAHWATPFIEAMNERTKVDARKKFPDPQRGDPIQFEFIPPAGRFPPARESLVTPAYLALKRGKNLASVRVDLPNCCFPAYRPDGAPSTITVAKPEHPIAQGIPATFSVLGTEMYDEPFHVPQPDEVIFEERWESGEYFRSGILWNIGKGKVFYFRPGHETFPVFKQAEVIQILANACKWLGKP